MKFSQKQIRDQVSYWKDTADNDWKTAQSLWKSKRYDACLFYCHLVLEKLLKGLAVQETKSEALHTHDLVELLRRANIKANEKQINKLAVFNGFNI